MKFLLETDRLSINEFTLADVEFIIQLLNSPGWIKYIGDRGVKTTEDAINYLKSGPLKSYSQHGFGLYRVELKNENKPIGMCGLLKREALEFPDLGFAFLEEYEGAGYAMESASAILSFARQHLNISTLLAITLPDNAKSVRLLMSLGFEFVRNIIMPPDEKMLQLYSQKIV
jgi:RimJ/RimL family protein N-acetyltransferase